jgi:hypothetical protein
VVIGEALAAYRESELMQKQSGSTHIRNASPGVKREGVSRLVRYPGEEQCVCAEQLSRFVFIWFIFLSLFKAA